ncbi:MAG TPA: ferredoxin family protein [Bacillota bacterium]|nr:ferredoxin family protein [Bacillota bacterium]
MAFVITSPCIGEKSGECVEVCPVDCIEEGEDMFYIDPDICIDCGACEAVCPVEAIYMEDEVPEEEQEYIELNRKFFENR